MIDRIKAPFTAFGFVFLFVIFFTLGSTVAYSQSQPPSGTSPTTAQQDLWSLYQYDPTTNRYIFSQRIGDIPLGLPLIMTPKQFEERLLKAQMNQYFKQKVSALSQTGKDDQAQKDLLPELYMNSKFFSSIFGGDEIDVRPQGSIGIDLGVRYQRSDNPGFSPRNRRNFGFDFDQRHVS